MGENNNPDNKLQVHVKKITKEDALNFHAKGKPGKLSVVPSKALLTQEDLSLAYSPGVAYPCIEINRDPAEAYDYTTKGNMVAVISNGTAVLGLGNLGALASKPVMEGKCVLMYKFAGIDAIDLEVSTENIEEFINVVRFLGDSFGGINLEDIKSPECFEIETRLQEIMDIPVFHDDQHGTAIICAAGLINACDLTNRKMEELVMVINGAGAAATACAKLVMKLGVKKENIYMCDQLGVIYKGRNQGMTPHKEYFMIETPKRTLAEALEGADVFLGLSVAGAVTKEMVKSMAAEPIIFAMANPVPEIMPEEIEQVRDDAIIATGRSDYNNQVNNVLGFPYIFRGALDVRARKINDEMKLAAAYALAKLARTPVPDEVSLAYSGKKMYYSKEYIIPVPFDPRLIYTIPVEVAKAAIESGVARKEITDWAAYEMELASRTDPVVNRLNLLYGGLRNNPSKILLSDGENLKAIMLAKKWKNLGYGEVALVVEKKNHQEFKNKLHNLDMQETDFDVILFEHNDALINDYASKLHAKIIKNEGMPSDLVHYRHFDSINGKKSKDITLADCKKLLNESRNILSVMLLEDKRAESMLAGLDSPYNETVEDVRLTLGMGHEQSTYGFSIIITKDRILFLADNSTLNNQEPQEVVALVSHIAKSVEKMGFKAKVTIVDEHLIAGGSQQKSTVKVEQISQILEKSQVKFKHEISDNLRAALNSEPSEGASILLLLDPNAALIASKMLSSLGDATVIGPVISGKYGSIQIVDKSANDNEIMTLCAIAALNSVNKKDNQ